MQSRSRYVGAITMVAALAIAGVMLFTRPARSEAAEPVRPNTSAPAIQKPTPLAVDRVTRRGIMVEVRGRTDPQADVTINGRPVPLISKDGSFTFFLSLTPKEQSAGITVTAEAAGTAPNTQTHKPQIVN